ncbi:MAG: hypothetical protein ACI8R4_000744 [Paracoccaceae bacterium]|jgi:hypothetical protein
MVFMACSRNRAISGACAPCLGAVAKPHDARVGFLYAPRHTAFEVVEQFANKTPKIPLA